MKEKERSGLVSSLTSYKIAAAGFESRAVVAGMTAWAGPWGISYAANITPDKNTGIGIWTEEMFVNAMRTGKHMGAGRPVLPPMPWQSVGTLNDEDLKAIFAYLQTVPAINNHVPLPVNPEGTSYE